MEKRLNISFSANAMFITYEKELDEFHKGHISVYENGYEEKAKEIANQVKWIKGFKEFSLGFGTIDWYESCDGFNVPFWTCSENGKRVKKDYIYYNDIPKDWTEGYTLTIEIPSSIRGINKFFEALNLNLNEKQINSIRKALKDKKYISIDL